jgi:hypothetical protein
MERIVSLAYVTRTIQQNVMIRQEIAHVNLDFLGIRATVRMENIPVTLKPRFAIRITGSRSVCVRKG